jgi:hypothetical protein
VQQGVNVVEIYTEVEMKECVEDWKVVLIAAHTEHIRHLIGVSLQNSGENSSSCGWSIYAHT